MSDTLLCPSCAIPYVPFSVNDKRQLALAKDYERVCPKCFIGLADGDSTPENLFARQSAERSYYLGIVESLRSIETAETLLLRCEVLRTALAPGSQVRYAWANVAPELLRELWAVMDRIGGGGPSASRAAACASVCLRDMYRRRLARDRRCRELVRSEAFV
jgi:hypothetical protein